MSVLCPIPFTAFDLLRAFMFLQFGIHALEFRPKTNTNSIADGITPADGDRLQILVSPNNIGNYDFDFLLNGSSIFSTTGTPNIFQRPNDPNGGFACNVNLGASTTNTSFSGQTVGMEFDD